MQEKSRRSAAEVAMLTIFLVITYDKEKSKTTTRFRVSPSTLRIISERKRLHSAFIEDWIDELAEFGWSAFQVGDHFAIIHTEAVNGWVRISSKRIRSTLTLMSLDSGEAIAEVAKAVIPKAPPDEVDEE